MLTKFSDVIKNTAILMPTNALQVNRVAHATWKNTHAVDEELKKHVKVRMVKDHTLHLIATSGVWAQEAQLLSGKILEKMNKEMKNSTQYELKRITVFVGNDQV